MKIRITGIGKRDAFYCDKKYVIGLVGKFHVDFAPGRGYFGGDFIPRKDANWKKVSKLAGWDASSFTFAFIKFEEIK